MNAPAALPPDFPSRWACRLFALVVVASRSLVAASDGGSASAATPDAPVIRLTPLMVEETVDQHARSRGPETFRPADAVGNLDLPRTQDDVLPFSIFDREQLNRSGLADLEEFMRRELLDSIAGTSPAQKSGPNAFGSLTSDASNLKLRGYGADETVILVNGRRMPESVTSGANAVPQSPNVNLIPLSLVERIEVLPVSASALYSGNPVGGVINIVLRANVDVTEVTARRSNATGFDAPQLNLSLLHGRVLRGGALRLRINASFSDSTPPTESELGYIRANLAARGAPVGRLHRATPNVRSADGSPLFGTGSAAMTSVAPGADGSSPAAAFADRAGVPSTALFDPPGALANTPDSADFPYGQRQRTASCYASATYDVFSRLQIGLDVMYAATTVTRGYDVFAAELKVPAAAPFNPFHQALEVSLNEFAPGLGEDYSQARRELSSVLIGTLWKLPADWTVSLDTQKARNVTRFRGLAGVSTARWQALIDRGVYNPLRDTQVAPPPPAFYEEALIYAGRRGQFVAVGDYDTLDSALRITNRGLRLPTGRAAVNVGGDFRITELKSYDDEQRFGNGTLATVPVHWRGRTLQRLSVFGELQAPLVPARWLPGWLREVETDLAARYTIADTTQEANVAPTVGVKIGLAGGWALRGSVATSNRFPTPIMNQKVTLAALRAASLSGVSYVAIFDPLRNEFYNVRAGDALNPNLRPEAAVTRTGGVIYERGREHRWRASVDLVDTEKSGELIYLDAQNLVNLAALFPERVTRAPLAAGDRHAAGYVNSLLTGNYNLAWRRSQNVNTAVDYTWLKCHGGTLDLYGRWMAFERYDRQLLPSSAIVDELNEPDGTAPGLLRNRLNLGGGWTNQRYGFRLESLYYGARVLPKVEWPAQGGRQIDPYWEIDASVQKDLTAWMPWKNPRRRLEAQLRVNNLFDTAPPRYANDPSGAGVQSYGDWRRQTYLLSLRAVF